MVRLNVNGKVVDVDVTDAIESLPSGVHRPKPMSTTTFSDAA
jgi:hypothetical protein